MTKLYKNIIDITRFNSCYRNGEYVDDSFTDENWEELTSNGHYELTSKTVNRIIEGILGNFKHLKSTIYEYNSEGDCITADCSIEYAEDDFLRLRDEIKNYGYVFVNDEDIIPGDDNSPLYKLVHKSRSYDMGHEENTHTMIHYDHDLKKLKEKFLVSILGLYMPGRITTVSKELRIYKLDLMRSKEVLIFTKEITHEKRNEMIKNNIQWIYPKKEEKNA